MVELTVGCLVEKSAQMLELKRVGSLAVWLELRMVHWMVES